jgi:type I restriction enzyme S subunit
MQGWDVRQLGDALKLEYGKPLPEADRDDDGAYPAYGANGVKCRTKKFFFGKPSIIVGRKGSAGEITLTEEKFWPLDVTYFVTFDERRHDLIFLYHCLKSLQLTRLAKGVKPGLNRNDVYSIEFAFPPLSEQKRIVAILDEAFEGIAAAVTNAEKNLANTRELFDNYLNSVFTQKGDGWVEKKLGDIATFKNGLNFTKNSKGELIKIVGVKDFQKNFSVPIAELETAQIDGTLGADYELKTGDILTVRSNGNKQLIGRCILANDVSEKTSHSGFTIRIRVASKDITPAYLVHFLKSKTSREMLIESGDGANISSLNQQALSALPVSLPSLKDQLAIVQKIEEIDTESKRLETIYQISWTTLQS